METLVGSLIVYELRHNLYILVMASFQAKKGFSPGLILVEFFFDVSWHVREVIEPQTWFLSKMSGFMAIFTGLLCSLTNLLTVNL